ncbi:hypothetical protein VNI00_003476 [Paramarasmius palmivorus]|uniref:Uncharacterized protein n=1 Tax=Paramarasmius palmivorus TaxID=297713 RepID=A0AAW0DRW6_9AGAR
MSSTVPDNYLASLSALQTVIRPASALSAMYFTYGIYVLLFGTYLYMTRSRNQTYDRRNKNLYLILAVVLFVLSTIFVVNYTIWAAHASIVRFNVVKDGDYDLFARYQTFDDFERRFGE